MLPQVGQVVETPAPAGIFVNLLQCHDIRLQPLDQPGDLQEVGPELRHRPQPLVEPEAAGMGDIEGEQAYPGHRMSKNLPTQLAMANRRRMVDTGRRAMEVRRSKFYGGHSSAG